MTNFAKASLSPCKKMVSFGVSLFRSGFKSSKCKTMAKLSVARIKLLRNKREVVVKQMRRDVALLLQSGQDTTARIRVEHVIREQNIMAANEIIELFCELIVARLSIIAKQRECPADLKEGVCSLIFAAPRCSDIPELLEIRDIFEKKYGKDFVGAATDLRPNCGVNRALIEKLSVRTPTGEVKLKIMKEIAKEYQIEWDTTESEKELLKPPEELIEGPHTFVSATSMPVKPVSSKSSGTNLSSNRLPGNDREEDKLHFDDMASAAKAAADSAEKAVAAAQAAAYLANRDTRQMSNFTGLRDSTGSYIDQYSSDKHAPGKSPSGPAFPMPSDLPVNLHDSKHHSKPPGRMYESRGFDRSHYSSDEEHLQDSKHHSKPPGRMYESQDFDRSHYSSDEEHLQHNKHHSKLPGRMYESQGFDRSRYSRDEELLQDSKHHSELPGRMYESQGFDRSHYSRDEEHLQDNKHYSDLPGRVYGSQGDRSRYSRDEEHGPVIENNRRINRRHSYSVPAAHSDIQFDESGESESECDEEIETEKPSGANCPAPDRLPPPVPSSHSYRQNSIPGVHRKLPDYDTISARFEALKLRKSS